MRSKRARDRERDEQAMHGQTASLRLISGTADPVSGAGMVRRYRELMPDGDVVTLRNIGHYPHLECPWEVFSAYREFRKRCEG